MSSNSNKVVEKASGIIAAIENCGCTHCIALLKSGLRPSTTPDADDTTIPEPTRNDQEIIR